ncbi:hypothetical protein B296_00004098 [Ensete ventricosum]|uniref:Uncharacterized protein n=1 Tax=Ensete ventricosum TaxID=4639 RepID=A0A426ZG50_ENSVE|nr:hypothetical protein B296_00004098 [Ensete ventricosum]
MYLFQWLDVLLKPQRRHRPQQIVPVDRLPLLLLASVTRPTSSPTIEINEKPKRQKTNNQSRRNRTPISLAGDEADKLGDALLHGLLGVLGDLGVGGESLLHDPDDIGDREEPILLPDATPGSRALLAALVAPASASGARRWSLRHPSSPLAAGAAETLDPCQTKVTEKDL